MLEKRCILNVQNTSKSRPRAAKRGPRPSQTFPKWGPRPSQVRFLGEFLACFFQLYNFMFFYLVFSWFLLVFLRADLENSCAHAVFCWLLHKIAIKAKSAKNQAKIIPKSRKNQRKIEEKSTEKRTKSKKIAKITQEAHKLRKNTKKLRKMAQHRPKTHPRGAELFGMAVSALACLAS